MTIACNILESREDGEESVSDTYLEAWNSIPPARPLKLKTYLGRLVRNNALDRARMISASKRGGGRYQVSLQELENCLGLYETEDSLDAGILSDALRRFVKGMDEEDRDLFIGRYYFMDQLKDIAEYCGMT